MTAPAPLGESRDTIVAARDKTVASQHSLPLSEATAPPYLLGFRRALYRGAGFSHDEVRRPLIGVANSWGEINPATRHLNVVSDRVKAGITAAGGTPVEFVLSGLCDGTCAAAPGYNRYNLPWRDIAVSYLEAVARANVFDGMVFVGVCDEVVPAHLLAAVRLDLPSILVLGGAMEPGRRPPGADGAAGGGGEVWAGDMTPAYAGTLDGSVSQAEYLALEDVACGGAGACPVMGTANTMHVFAEACGLTLPGNAVMPGASLELEDLAYAAGLRAVELVQADLRPSAVFTQAALENAVRAVVAAGGSTCAVLHVLALSAEAGLSLGLDDFDRLSRATPLLVDVRPSGRHSATDFHRAGGVSGLLANLSPLLHLEARMVTGETLGDRLAAVPPPDPAVIRPLTDPLAFGRRHGGAARQPGSRGSCVQTVGQRRPPLRGAGPGVRDRGGRGRGDPVRRSSRGRGARGAELRAGGSPGYALPVWLLMAAQEPRARRPRGLGHRRAPVGHHPGTGGGSREPRIRRGRAVGRRAGR